jgi:hypothetical protein
MHFTTQAVALVASLLSMAAAAPTADMASKVARGEILVLPGTTDQGQITTTDGVNVEKRGATDEFGDYNGSKSQYPDGSGTYLRSGDVHRYASGDKCWTDMWYVTSSFVENTDWVRKGSVDCDTTSECEMGLESGVETCTNWSLAFTAGFEASISALVTASFSLTSSIGGEKCNTLNTASICKWSTGGCHAIWASTSVKTNHGYIRRRCDFHDGKGDVTVWSKDWDVSEKASQAHLGCEASCSDGAYTYSG